ncbi:hypothetical protein chiPu_0024545, partial [Chiloscyllium punctatum]|nr:hypothetical protein [Chiloscyllium punctatum]
MRMIGPLRVRRLAHFRSAPGRLTEGNGEAGEGGCRSPQRRFQAPSKRLPGPLSAQSERQRA